MNILTVDMETYYSQEFSLSKVTNEEYVRSPEFEVIGVSVQVNDGEPEWFSGTMAETATFLKKFDWANSLALAHNAAFDASILTWVFGIKPKGWLDTLSMGRALHGTEVGGSLAVLAQHYGVGTKGTEVVNAKGLRRVDFPADQLERYGEYCCNDTAMTYALFQKMSADFPPTELRLIDLTIRMFSEPRLWLDVNVLKAHLGVVVANKELALGRFSKDDLMSNPRFADLLREQGVEPPMKQSPTTGKQTYAMAKNDEAFKALLEHGNPMVQALVGARLGVKSTIEETRTARFIGIAGRGFLPVPLRYYAAHTGRWGGDDKLNLQNLPRSSPLKYAIIPEAGYVILDSDSSQIEARTLAWLAGQDDLVDAFDRGEDVYKIMASAIYNKAAEEITKGERFVGKTTILGAGYGMGAAKFQLQLKNFGVAVELEEAKRIIDTYRATYPMIVKLWATAGNMLKAILQNQQTSFGRGNLLQVNGSGGVKLPNGLYLKYPNLRLRQDEESGKTEIVYDTKKGKAVIPNRIYGGKVIENCIAEGTEVLTDMGWIPIEKVTAGHRVHDGVEFVFHGGMVFKSVQACVTIDGVYMTPDHEVLTNDGWKAASQNPQPYRPDLRHVDGVEPRAQQWEEKKLEISMRMRNTVCQGGGKYNQRNKAGGSPQLRMCDQATYVQGEYSARYEQAPGVRGMAVNVRSLPTTFASSMGELWWSGYQRMRAMAGKVREFLVGYGANLRTRVGLGPQGQRWPVLAGELPLDFSTTQLYEQAQHRAQGGRDGTKQTNGYSAHNTILPTSSWMANRSAISEARHEKPVYDIMDAGPRSRFVVKGTNGPFLVHNCCQALARIVIGEQMLLINKKYPVVMTVHDAIAIVVPKAEAETAKEYVELCMRLRPSWAPELPLNCEAGYGESYGDC